METLVPQHRNQYYSREKANSPARFGPSPPRGFRDINCRTFESGSGSFQSPLKILGTPKTQIQCAKFNSAKSEDSKTSKKFVKSGSIAIDFTGFKGMGSNDSMSFPELWAGPAYSNSPPPSSLPMPKFSVKPRRTVSLELPASESDANYLHPMAKSAPASPTRGSKHSQINFLRYDDSATKTLRRILNLDIVDD